MPADGPSGYRFAVPRMGEEALGVASGRASVFEGASRATLRTLERHLRFAALARLWGLELRPLALDPRLRGRCLGLEQQEWGGKPQREPSTLPVGSFRPVRISHRKPGRDPA